LGARIHSEGGVLNIFAEIDSCRLEKTGVRVLIIFRLSINFFDIASHDCRC